MLIGGGGPDSLHGDGGRDSFNMRDGVELAAKGRDRIYARDGHPDEINCGAGRDLAVVDEVEDGVYRLRGGAGSRDRPRRPTTPRGSPGASSPTPRPPSGSRPSTATSSCAGASSSAARRRSPGLAGMAGVLPAETLVAEAAKRAARKPLPKPRDLPIDTFVVLMMENRSFDHYFGWHPKADAKNAGLSYPNLDGSQTLPDPSPDPRLPGL